ncbi:MAG: ABC transporter permease [Anaerolineales bacterium]|nr:ABC transporter permease [Anaerolineales bacterium]
MRKILTLAWKDTLLRFSGASELLFFLILPVAFTFLLGGGVAGFGGDGDETADSRIPLLVADADGSALAQQLLATLAESTTVRLDARPLAEAEAAFAAEEAPALLLVPAGFEAALLAGDTAVLDLRQLPDNTNAQAAGRAVETAVSRITQPLAVARNVTAELDLQRPFASDAARRAAFNQSLALAQTSLADAPPRVAVTRPAAANENADDEGFSMAALSSAGQLITCVFIPLLGTSGFLALERSRGTLRRLLTTPTRGATYLLGTITGQYLVGLVQMVILVAFGIWVMGVDWGNSLPGLAIMLLTFGLASVAFGTMLGTFVKTENQASNLSIMLGMSMALLGGCWWPLELFPPFMQTASKILPTAWAMQGLRDLSMRGLGVNAILPEAAVLLGFAALFFVVGTLRFRYE